MSTSEETVMSERPDLPTKEDKLHILILVWLFGSLGSLWLEGDLQLILFFGLLIGLVAGLIWLRD